MFTYSITKGVMLENGAEMDAGKCYSGAPEAKNNPAMCRVHEVGPVCPGSYSIGPPFTDPEKGPLVMRLTPLPGTDTHGRSGFEIHGDSIHAPGTASHGCIIASHQMRAAIAVARDRVLVVTG